jgi:peptidoglycan/LPS O-acetylase OafA/YrhL
MSLFRIDLKLNERIFGLDLMRAVAIIMVLLLNGDPLLRRNFPDFPRFWFIDGVDLFFVLSGFLIGRILIKTFEKNGFKFPVIVHFWKFRWFRTLPNYYLVLLITMFFVYMMYGNLQGFNWKYLFFLQNITNPIPPFFTVSWSLVVEEWFYLTFPLIAFAYSKMLPHLKVRQVILLTIILFIILPLCYRIAEVFANVDPANLGSLQSIFNFEKQFRSVAVFRLDSIAFGVLGAYLAHYHESIWHKYRYHSFIAGILLYVVFRGAMDFGLNKFTTNFSFCAFALFLLLPLASSVRSAPARIAIPVTYLSMISYSVYLIHRTIIMDSFRRFGGRPFSDLQAISYYIAYFVLTIAISAILYKFFEAPMMKLRERNYSFRKPIAALPE